MITYTRRPTKIGNALVIWIPKDIVDHLKINVNMLLEIKLKKVE